MVLVTRCLPITNRLAYMTCFHIIIEVFVTILLVFFFKFFFSCLLSLIVFCGKVRRRTIKDIFFMDGEECVRETNQMKMYTCIVTALRLESVESQECTCTTKHDLSI